MAAGEASVASPANPFIRQMLVARPRFQPCSVRRRGCRGVCRAWWNVAGSAALAATTLVPLSVAADALVDRATQRVEKRCNVDADGVRCFIASPSSGTSPPNFAPVVLVLHELFGLQDREIEFCKDLAKRGYIAIAVDVFQGRSSKWIPRVISFGIERVLLPRDPDYGVSEVMKVLKWLETQKWHRRETKVGIVGFCYGGGGSIRAAIAAPNAFAAVGVFYGNPPPQEALDRIPCPVFAVYGTEDAQFSQASLNAFDDALQRIPGSSFRRFNGQGHAFVKDLEETRKDGAAQEAWNGYTSFLEETLKP